MMAVGLRKSMARLAALLDQEAPLEHDVLGYCQCSLLEHRSHFMGKPIVQFGAARSIRQQFDAEAYFGESDDADVKRFEGLTPHERDDLGFRLRAAKLENDVGIEEPCGHSDTSRTGSDMRPDSMLASR